jgi:hypothetical protein
MTLAPHEQAFMERFNEMPNPLGWKPAGRDENGVAQMKCVTQYPGGHSITVMAITEKGLVYTTRHYKEVPNGAG